MTSTIKVDNVQNQPGTNVINKCGTDVTIGASGDTVALACGASQTGFGRTGTVDWDTSIKTGTVTAVTGKGYFVNTTSGGITVNLPAGAVGSIVAVSDYASTAASNNITIAPNGSEKINGVNDDFAISTAGLAVTLVYADATRGWKSVTGSDEDATGLAPAWVAASGGNTTITCGDYKVHVFTGPGTFCVSNAGNPKGSGEVDYLVVAGGASGGSNSPNADYDSAGGGGAGGMQYSISTVPAGHPIASPTGIAVPVAPYSIVVGAGGATQPCRSILGNPGSVSSFSTIPSAGGGGGGSSPGAPGGPSDGGSGGGGGGGGSVPSGTGGAGNTPPTSPLPAQGFAGGNGGSAIPVSPDRAGGGGGGAAAVGGNASGGAGGDGGVGAYVPGPWFGPTSPSYGQAPTPLAPNGRYFSGGGGGSSPQGAGPPFGGPGGAGGGGGYCAPVLIGGINTGGGGGGASANLDGSAGGSGIVVIRYKFQ